MDTITPITCAELRAKITERMERRETDGSALFTLRRGLRLLELFATPDTLGGDVALDICHAVDEVETLLSQRDELAEALKQMTLTFGDTAFAESEAGQDALTQAEVILSKLSQL